MLRIAQTTLAALSSLVIVVSGAGTVHAAGSGTLSMSTNAASYTAGSEVKVTISEDSGTQEVNAVQADLTYNPAQLQFLKISDDASAFSVAATGTGAGGNVKIARASIAKQTGKKTVATVTFKALSGSGSLAFAPTSAIMRASDNTSIWNGSIVGASYAVKGIAAATPAPASTNTSSSGAQDAAASPQATNLVAVQVATIDGETPAGIRVTIGDQTQVTDQNGYAGFVGLDEGTYQVTSSYQGEVTKSNITVEANKGDSKPQQVKVKLAAAKKTSAAGAAISGTLLMLLVLGATAVFILRRRMRLAAASSAVALPADPLEAARILSQGIDMPQQPIQQPTTPPQITQPVQPTATPQPTQINVTSAPEVIQPDNTVQPNKP